MAYTLLLETRVVMVIISTIMSWKKVIELVVYVSKLNRRYFDVTVVRQTKC